MLLLFDGESGFPLAVMDSMEITILRTAAATAVAAKHCARENARTVTMWGAGDQARAQVLALACVRPIRRALVYDLVRERAEGIARELEDAGLEARAVEDARAERFRIVPHCSFVRVMLQRHKDWQDVLPA